MDYPFGLDPYTSRQHLLHHTYSPLISIQSTNNADAVFQKLLNNDEISVLQVLKPYGNNAKYSIPNQSFKIINNQLITKNYPSFPVRFEPGLSTLVDLVAANSNQLFSITSLEHLLRQLSTNAENDDLYLKLFNKIIISNKLVPFETFNHPILQIFVIDYESCSLQDLRTLIVNFRNSSFPKYFQINDLLVHVFVVYHESQTSLNDITQFQNRIKSSLNIYSTVIPIVDSEPLREGCDDVTKFIKVNLSENSTIQEDLQRLTLQQQSKRATGATHLNIPKSIDKVLRNKLYEFISKHLIPHMQTKIRAWDDQVLQPRKSITNRFFLASKKIFNTSNTSSDNPTGNFNYQESFYYKSTTEQTIRKLADWSLILKDFKYAYSTYDLIKKDYINDKAWAYVASTQEMCMVSLLLAQTQQVTPQNIPDKNMLRKIRHDIIEPYMDNLSYTFVSRLNLKTYNLRTLIIVVELLLCMSNYYNISNWWNDLIEKYLGTCVYEFDQHLMAKNQLSQIIKAILYERIGYSFGRCINLPDRTLIDFNEVIITNITHKVPTTLKDDENISEQEENTEDTEEYYKNPNKLLAPANSKVAGLTRFRKSSIWYLFSIKEWMSVKNYKQVEYLMNNIKLVYNIWDLNPEKFWYDRGDLLLGYIKRSLKEQENNRDTDK
jgi:hypothetical protein